MHYVSGGGGADIGKEYSTNLLVRPDLLTGRWDVMIVIAPTHLSSSSLSKPSKLPFSFLNELSSLFLNCLLLCSDRTAARKHLTASVILPLFS